MTKVLPISITECDRPTPLQAWRALRDEGIRSLHANDRRFEDPQVLALLFDLHESRIRQILEGGKKPDGRSEAR